MVSGCQRHAAWCDQQEELCFLLKALVCLEEGRFRLDTRQKFFTVRVAQRSCGHPLPGSVQGRAEWGTGQLGLLEGIPAHGRGGLEPDDL